MSRFYYDFHNHSCLSPCGDDDCTPASLAGMGALAGLDLMALTDHNTVKNCPAFYAAAESYGVIPIAGMELTTAEDIHVVCLFETLDEAMSFGETVRTRRMRLRNKPETFGNQLIMNENDEVTGIDPFLLVVATTIALEEVVELVTSHNGICYPAHIDRQSGGAIAILGGFPEDAGFKIAELRHLTSADGLCENHPAVAKVKLLTSGDAHRLEDVRDAEDSIELDADKSDPDAVRAELFKKLREGRF